MSGTEWVETPDEECECYWASGDQNPCKVHLEAGYGKAVDEREEKERRAVITTSKRRA